MNSRTSVLLALSTGMIVGIAALPFLPKVMGPVAPRAPKPVSSSAAQPVAPSPAAVALAKSACVGSVEGFLNALCAGDQEAYDEFLTAMAIEGLDADNGLAFNGDSISIFEVGEAEVGPAGAHVSVAMGIRDQMQYMDFQLREEQGTWSIYGASLMVGEESVLIDFEEGPNALGSVAEKMLAGVSMQSSESSSSMDLSLENLDYEGAGPVSVEFIEFVDRKDPEFTRVNVKVQNLCNQVVSKVEVQFHYLNAEGEELDSFPHALAGPVGFNGQAPLAVVGSQKVNNVTAFYVPDGTQTIRVEVLEVLFEDQAIWTAK